MTASSEPILLASGAADSHVKSENFDRDPNWEGYNNRNRPTEARTVEQDFGYSKTQFASSHLGEIGGSVQRASTPAYYGAPLSPGKTLDDKISASGTFTVTARKGSGGVFFGFFNSQQSSGGGRPINSLGLDLGFKKDGGSLAVRLITSGNQTCGTFITPFIPGKFRPTPLKLDGTRYHWTLDYDPRSGGGNGRFTFTLRSDTHTSEDYGTLPKNFQSEADAHFPKKTTFSVDVPPEMRKEGAIFNRFGLCNVTKAGGRVSIFFGDLEWDGQREDFSKDPGWTGSGNRNQFQDYELAGAHDYGYSAKTAFAGGSTGEIGGILWRGLPFSFYADRVGPLDLNHRLEASGKIILATAGPDSDIFLGWFNSAAKDKGSADTRNFIGIHVGGPTRVGHYFIPMLVTAKGTKNRIKSGPVIKQGKIFDWSLVYDPDLNGGSGEMRVALGADTVTLALKPGQKAEGAMLDRFGLFNSTVGGQMVKIYLDDLKYSVR